MHSAPHGVPEARAGSDVGFFCRAMDDGPGSVQTELRDEAGNCLVLCMLEVPGKRGFLLTHLGNRPIAKPLSIPCLFLGECEQQETLCFVFTFSRLFTMQT